MSSALAQPDSAADDFGQFSFHPSLEKGLSRAGFEAPRPIQRETIPACLDGRDVMGLAQTGTGKTAAFALPILQRLIEEPGRGPLVMILAPTRELAIQIHAEIEELARFAKVQATTLIGGVPIGKQLRALRRDPEIVVGCPGRVLDLIQQRELDVRGIDTLVLDEADHMFDMGFLPDLRRILKSLPDDRQNLLFSATMPREVRKLANDLLDDPHVVELAPSAPAEAIEHGLFETDSTRKQGLLDALLSFEDCGSAIVFTRTKHRAKRLADKLDRQGRRAVALQGNMSQGQRQKAMGGFREGRFDILVATDIAARGIDVAGIDYVVNFDPPDTPETYTHRIGRTGRAGASGRAITFVTREDRGWVRDTERMLGEKLIRFETPEVEVSKEALESPGRRGHGRGGAGRGSRSRNGGHGGAGRRSNRPGADSGSRDGQRAGANASAKEGGRSGRGGASKNRSRRGAGKSEARSGREGAPKAGGRRRRGGRPNARPTAP
ncbi:MAG: DEAD/DEAH box helicase [bacterium]|nr:DEAD/DEAH box helicase [bacterium]